VIDMARLSPEERKALEDQLAADDTADDDDDEVEVGFGDGSYVKGKYRRVADAAAARGFKLKPDPAPEGDGKSGARSGRSNVTQGRFVSGRRTG
jgi:hypothetical protein